jgi:hypothetical protein
MLLPWLSRPDPGPSIPDEETVYYATESGINVGEYLSVGGRERIGYVASERSSETNYRIFPTKR